MIHRRNFLVGLVAVPAIVRIDSIMPVKLFDVELPNRLLLFRREVAREYVRQNLFKPYIDSELTTIIDVINNGGKWITV